MKFRILYISYWGIHEGITQATALSNVAILRSLKNVDKAFLVTLERSENNVSACEDHYPIKAGNRGFGKVKDHFTIPIQLHKIVRDQAINLIICRTSLAGILGYKLMKRTGVPFIVESLEPHHEYMKETGVWNRYGISYHYLKQMELKLRNSSEYLIPLNSSYREKLVREGIDREKILVAPCTVNPAKFLFTKEDRRRIRKNLGIGANEIVGIYVGKFGDIYLKDKAFRIFKIFQDNIKKFRLLILTPQDQEAIISGLNKEGLNNSCVSIIKTNHSEVPGYLSASDFAFSLIKPSRNRRYCSPIKNGEYWAMGLPVVITEGVGDDSEIIKNRGIGVVLEDTPQKHDFETLFALINDPGSKKRIRQTAIDYRSPELVRKAYQTILD